MAVSKGDDDSIRPEIADSGKRISGEAGLGLLAIGNDRRSGMFEQIYRVAKCVSVGLVECFATDFPRVKCSHGLNQGKRPGNTADRFGLHAVQFIAAAAEGPSIERWIRNILQLRDAHERALHQKYEMHTHAPASRAPLLIFYKST